MNTNTLVNGDCLKEMKKIREGSVDLVFADPPFNIGYKYDSYNDSLSSKEYLKWTEEWLNRVNDVLKPNGSLYIAIGDEYAAELKIRIDKLGMTMRNWIIWHYTFGVSCKKKFSRSHTHILYYVKDKKNFTFNDDEVRVESARQKVYKDKRANPKGKIPDSTWVLRPDEVNCFSQDSDTWNVSRVCGTFKERTEHPCQMPELLLERIIKVSSNKGDMVLDPFAGSGTTLVVAKKLERRFIGIEISPKYINGIVERLRSIK